MPVRRREGLSLFAFALLCAALLWPLTLSAEFPQAVVNGVSDEPWKGEYQYDGAGNIKKIGTNHYLYDGALRLVEATANTNAQSDVRNYSYDAFGNLLRIDTNHDSTHSWIFAVDPKTNRMDADPDCAPGSTCFFASYDTVVGHQLTGPDNAGYDYDAVDMLTSLNNGLRHELYIYDANDQRIATVTNATTTTPVWRYTLRDAGSNVIRVWTSSGGSWSWSEDYVHRNGILLASISDSSAGEQRSHFHVDHLNSPRLITDDEGRKISIHTYWPFGLEAAGSDADHERRKYTGHERDLAGDGDINDLDYMHARYYAPVENRFLSIDPFTDFDLTLKEPQRWNRYSYVKDSPILYTDPDGRDMKDFFAALGPAAVATGRDLARIGGNLVHAPEVQEAVQGFKSGDAKERMMASAVILIAVADVAANALQPEKAEIQALGKTAVKETAVMLGHLGPELTAAAEKAGAGTLEANTRFTGQVWSWAKNKAWMKEAIESGREILLAVDPSKIRKGSVLEKEIKYLEKKGFEVVGSAQEGWRLIRR